MVIPSISQGKITEALKVFDRKHRNTPEFIGWEHKGTQRYAIVDSGRLYPPKMIISLAAGIRHSGLWNTQQLEAEPLDEEHVEYIKRCFMD